mmetsp:Transcript_8905/g.30271  ORF Transcript_8905/g.30271 Transcript_8905/m.30271 type:complete len:148 (-) Transcript_8905:123-566(-)
MPRQDISNRIAVRESDIDGLVDDDAFDVSMPFVDAFLLLNAELSAVRVEANKDGSYDVLFTVGDLPDIDIDVDPAASTVKVLAKDPASGTSVERVAQVPAVIKDTSKVTASYVEGVVFVTLPKAAIAPFDPKKVKHIAVRHEKPAAA